MIVCHCRHALMRVTSRDPSRSQTSDQISDLTTQILGQVSQAPHRDVRSMTPEEAREARMPQNNARPADVARRSSATP
jgi:hypothetical protein